MGKMGKSQVSIYVIIGMFILFAVLGGTIFFLNNNKTDIQRSADELNFEANAEGLLSSYIESCLKQTTIEAEQKLGIDERLSPPLIRQYVSDNLDSCLNDFKEFRDRDYKIEKGQLSVRVTISEDSIVVKITYPVTLKKDRQTINFEEESYTFPRTVMEDLNPARATTITSPDGTLVMEIPPGTSATLNGEKVDKVGLKLLDRNFQELSNSVVAGMLAFQGIPEGVVFDKPVKITKYYNKYDVPLVVSEQDFSLGYYNSELGLWVGVPTEVDVPKQKLTAEVMHFTPFATVTDCTGQGALTLESVITPHVVPYSGWKSESLEWMPAETSGGPNNPPDSFTCTGEGMDKDWLIYYQAKSISDVMGKVGSGEPIVESIAASDITNLELKEMYAGAYYKDCKKEYTYPEDIQSAAYEENYDNAVASCKEECPKGSAKYCEDDNVNKITCQAIYFGFEKNDGTTADGINKPNGLINVEIQFDNSGDACILDPNGGNAVESLQSRTCGPAEFGAACELKTGDEDDAPSIVKITPADCESDSCLIGKAMMSGSAQSPLLDFNLYSVNKAGSATEVGIMAGAKIELTGVGVSDSDFYYNCGDDTPTVKYIGDKCYSCVEGKYTQMEDATACFDKKEGGACAIEGCFISLDEESCLECRGGVFQTFDDPTKCPCLTGEDNSLQGDLIRITGRVAGNAGSSSLCLNDFDPNDPNGNGGGGGGETPATCTGDEQCPSGQICHGGKCTPKSGGGGSGDCSGGDSEIKRYPECDDAKNITGKYRLGSSCVLDTRTLKFCDTNEEISNMDLEVKGSALRNGACYLMVSPGSGEDIYVKFDPFIKCAEDINPPVPPPPPECEEDADCDSNEYCTIDKTCEIKEGIIAGILSTGLSGFSGIHSLGAMTAGFNWFNENITADEVLNYSADNKMNFILSDNPEEFRTANKKIDLSKVEDMLESHSPELLVNDSHFIGYLTIKDLCNSTRWDLSHEDLSGYYDKVKSVNGNISVFMDFNDLNCFYEFTKDRCDDECGGGDWFVSDDICYRTGSCNEKCTPDPEPPCAPDTTGMCSVSCMGNAAYVKEGECYSDNACTSVCSTCISILDSVSVEIRESGFVPGDFTLRKGLFSHGGT